MKTGTDPWQNLTEFHDLWVIDRNPDDAWFRYFDVLTQFELSRNLKSFENKTEPWLFSASKYLPANLIFLADFSNNSTDTLQTTWKKLGSPKALIYSASHSAVADKLAAMAPESFHRIQDTP